MWAWLKKVFAAMVRALSGLVSRRASSQSTQSTPQSSSGTAASEEEKGEGKVSEVLGEVLGQLSSSKQRMQALFDEITTPNLNIAVIKSKLREAKVSIAQLAVVLGAKQAIAILQNKQLLSLMKPVAMATLYYLHRTKKDFVDALFTKKIPTIPSIFIQALQTDDERVIEKVRVTILSSTLLSAIYHLQIRDEIREKMRQGAPQHQEEAKKAAPDLPTFDIYEKLGVRRTATPVEIKHAYRELARKLHPDHNFQTLEGNRFKELSEAYACLIDAPKRNKWDALHPIGESIEPKAGRDPGDSSWLQLK